MKNEFTPTIDKLKICYKVAENSYLNILRDNPTEEFEHPDWGYRLRLVQGTHFNYIYEIVYLDYKDNTFEEFTEQVFGTLEWGLKSDTEEAMQSFVWLHVNNKQFYLKHDYQHSRLVNLEYIEDTLGLVFNNITHLDIAIDSSCNFPKKLIQLIRNIDYNLIVNGTKIADRKQLIEDILYIGVGNRERIKEYGVLVAQRNKNITLNAYNKKREIESKSHKQYILDNNGNPKKLYRLEVRINSDVLKDFFTRSRIEYSPRIFLDSANLLYLFMVFLNRVIRFQDKNGRKSYNVLELI